METFEIVVTTCDKYVWAIKPFCHLFNKYFPHERQVHIICESSLNINDYPGNFTFHALGEWKKENWSDGLREFIGYLDAYNILLMLDDYWLTRGVDIVAIKELSEYMVTDPSVLRIDLTSDRLYSMGDVRNVRDVFTVGHCDIIESDAESYKMSLQSGLFNINLLGDILVPDKSPWEIELHSTDIIINSGMKIYGTRQHPVRYTNALGTGTPEMKVNMNGLDPEDYETIKKLWIPKEYSINE